VRDLQILRTLAELDLASRPSGARTPAARTALRFALRILTALTRLVAGDQEPMASGAQCDVLLTERLTASAPSPQSRSLLSQREIETLALTELGLSNREIARRMCIEEATVKKHQSNLLKKLEARNRTQAVARARLLGVLR
jgi:LuxR family maltose regulon positive regulatory protein